MPDAACALQAAFGGKVTSDDIRIVFGPNDRKIGRQYRNDPSVDESQLQLQQFSVLTWLDRFPHWQITARPIQHTPPPPGVAIKKAAASAEGKDPEKAVLEARAKVRTSMPCGMSKRYLVQHAALTGKKL